MSSKPKSEGPDSQANAIDIHEIMARIRTTVAEKLATPREKFNPLSVTPTSGGAPVAGELLHSNELRIINQRHAFSLDINPGQIGNSHRGGILGRGVTWLKRKLLVLVRDAILSDYLKAEHEYHSALTQFLNSLCRYVDQRDSSNFWELVRKIDVDSAKSVERIDRIADEMQASLEQARQHKNGFANLQTTQAVNVNAPIAITPAMSPQTVALVQHINALSLRLQQIETKNQNS